MSNIVVRKAQSEDTVLLANLARTTFMAAFAESNESHFMQEYVNQAFTPSQIGDEMQDANAHFYVVERDSRLVAYAKLLDCVPPECVTVTTSVQLERIYVAPELTGYGIGRMLMDQMVGEATQLGFSHIWLGAWKENTGAARFYENFGFEVVGEKIFMLGKDAQEDSVFLYTIDS